MNKFISLYLFFILSTASFGQLSIDVGEEFINSGNIYQDDKIIGRFVYSFIEKISDSINRFEIKLYDDSYNEMADLNFEHSPITLEKIIVNQGKFVLFFESNIGWVIATVGGDKVIQKEVVLKSDLEKKKLNTITMNYYAGQYQGDNSYEVIGNSMFLTLTNDWGFKTDESRYSQAFKLTGYDANLKKKWSFFDTNDKRTVARIIGKSDKYVALVTRIFEGIGRRNEDVKSKLYVIDLSSGKVMCRETLMGFDSQSLLITKAIFDENDQNVLLCGKYYEDGNASIEKPSEGLVILDFNLLTKEKEEKRVSWVDLTDSVQEENLYNLSKIPSKLGRIKYLHEAFLWDSNNIGLVYESMKDFSIYGTTTLIYVCFDLTTMTPTTYVMKGKKWAALNSGEYMTMGHFLLEETDMNADLAVCMFRPIDTNGQIKVICHMAEVTSIGSLSKNKGEEVKEDELVVLTLKDDSFAINKVPLSMNYDFVRVQEGAGDFINVLEYDTYYGMGNVPTVLRKIRFELLNF